MEMLLLEESPVIVDIDNLRNYVRSIIEENESMLTNSTYKQWGRGTQDIRKGL